MPADRLRVGVVGGGDVAHRHYLPALAEMRDRVEVTAVADTRLDAARRAVATVGSWSPGALAFDDLGAMLDEGVVDAVIDIVPATGHAVVNQAVLDAGLHLYSEKPIAGTLADADRLIDTANARGVRFLAAPAVAATRRFQWLAELVRSGRYGRATLLVARHADPGPAAWREYTGDPRPFYAEGVGPVFDHGVYRLHGMTMLLGPVARVQAMGAIGVPARTIRGGPLAGQRFEVTSPDHVLINLEFAGGALGQLLASFGTVSTRAPWLEVHLTGATLSFGGQEHDKDAPVSILVDDDSTGAGDGWRDDLDLPTDPTGVVETGVRHFIDCVEGRSQPILTAEHARHVLDVILKAYASIADGASHATETTF